MRNGLYGSYKGKLYEARVKDSKTYILCSYNKEDIINGFSLYKDIVYVKTVSKDDVEYIYRITTFAEYNYIKVQVIKETNDKILISKMDGDCNLLLKIGMEKVDKGIYQKWVSKDSVSKIYEEKELL
ncbi:hypothetical protein [Vallitalea guaymasensis]|uniref:Uncharacterized protein n=1 Tax=Vallitalea guaymasensis TaxID=1185412 RepID=A0A8J8M9X3_9FIRM|nr:hypothetical protein [Vallitalea guaymasensis]QUH28815.1 hypothetical protein HYG85_07765 [Vallitalea guaymasensis]